MRSASSLWLKPQPKWNVNLLGWLMMSCLMLFACEERQSPSDQVFDGQILDQESVFSPEATQALTQHIDSLEGVSGLDLMVITVADPGPEGLMAYAALQKNRLKLGKPGIHNAALLYLSVLGRQVKVEIDHGLEWMISDTTAGRITANMTPLLAAGKYQEALTTALSQIAGYSTPEDWSLPEEIWNWSDTLVVGKLICVQGNARGRAYQSGVSPTEQFHSNYFLEVENPMDSDDVLFLLFSRYMQDMADMLVYGDSPLLFAGRVIETDPVVISLTGLLPSIPETE